MIKIKEAVIKIIAIVTKINMLWPKFKKVMIKKKRVPDWQNYSGKTKTLLV